MRPPSAIALYLRLGLTPIPLKPRSKEPVVKWHNGWNPTPVDLQRWATKSSTNWGVRCGSELAALDFDSDDAFHRFMQAHPEAAMWPRIKTGRGYHLWVRPKKPVSTQHLDGIEVRYLGSYVVAPPSTHPSGMPYVFEVAPDGALSEVDLEALLGPLLGEKPQSHIHSPIAKPEGLREEFRGLMAKQGVFPGDNPTWCFAHDDNRPGGSPSLSVDWQGCRFKCFSPRCGVHGGLGTLRRLAGEIPPFVPKVSNYEQAGVSERGRLVSALREAGEVDSASAVNSCHRDFRAYRCKGCGKTPAYPVSCGLPLCPECLGRRFFAFWEKHKGEMEAPIVLMRLTPKESFPLAKESMKKVRERYTQKVWK